MTRLLAPVRSLFGQVGAAVFTLRGRRLLRRGRVQDAVRAFRTALAHRPERFRTLIDLATAHLCGRDVHQACRALALAREIDPRRFEMRAGRLLARWGFDVSIVTRSSAPPREPVVQAATRAGRSVTARSLPFGDCRNLDEYARFRAMPPISRAEVDGTDWDRVVADLFDD